MTKEETNKAIGNLRTKYQKSINDLFIWTSIAVNSLEYILNDEIFLSRQKYEIPSKKTDKKVNRNKESLIELITDAKDTQFNQAIFSYVVAQMEAFFQEVLLLILSFDNKKLSTKINGIDHLKKIDVLEIINRGSYESIIESIIEKELMSLFYSRPDLQFEYLEAVTDITLENNLKNKWVEFKASRDLIVHNSGKINQLYIKKAGTLARGVNGDDIIVDSEYLKNSLTTIKSIVGTTCSQIQKNLK